ncbi:methionine aminopeptidase, type I [Thermanaerovibrio acidaminovorans DSM 6589]|jgi:methionyl aminopeptidase|uniref:Methionine aminopeptidase n=1 Tax=Thermanaerovibrio acidaminovorans (strain ATCC 49978 / DSM 6589 / Su883) TaxID=525903 RepID=D1B5V3_THEAS|nr:type I methionyl aminopeptidase [Thermanaerovibrio acidaminovorans]ACZ19394.1 methionine aminopeptidase, type I [Thermanaerovibrio acidaminovorans DSM 6589]
MITFKSPSDLAHMRRAGVLVADVLRYLRGLIKPGVDTLSLDRFAEDLIVRGGGRPAFKGYKVPGIRRPFPGTICASINEEVVHGIPSADRILREGDILSVDVGVSVDGWYADAACTYPVGEISDLRRRLLEVTLGGLKAAMGVLREGATVGDVGSAVERVVKGAQMGLVRDYAGHGIGRRLHEAPQIPNYGRPGSGITLKSRMTICVEPMVMTGGEAVRSCDDGWTVVTADGSDAAHFEHTLLVTPDGCEVLTPWED